MGRRSFFFFTALIFTVFAFTSCSNKRIPVTKTKIALGTYIQMTVITVGSDSERAERTIENAFKEIEKFEKNFDYRNENGELFKFNSSTRILKNDSGELFPLLTYSLTMAKATEGYFDPTVLPIIRLYGFDTDNPGFPGDDKIREGLKHVGYSKVTVFEDKIIKPEEVKFDLSGIAKGKTVDFVRGLMKHSGYQDFLINAGGDIYAGGLNADKKKWRIAIQDPLREDRYSGIIEKTDTAIVTSGDYERFFMEDGIRYSHLFNPKTGYPFSDCKSVTILSEGAAYADAVATAVFSMGSEEGYLFISKNNIKGFIIYMKENGRLETKNTPGFWE